MTCATGGATNNHSSIYQSPFASHPRSNTVPGAPANGKAVAAGVNGMPALPTQTQGKSDAATVPMPQVHRVSWLHKQESGVVAACVERSAEDASCLGCKMVAHTKEADHSSVVQVPTTPAPRTSLGARARSANDVSAISGREDPEQPACFSGESNDSHAEHQVYVPAILALPSVVSTSPYQHKVCQAVRSLLYAGFSAYFLTDGPTSGITLPACLQFSLKPVPFCSAAPLA